MTAQKTPPQLQELAAPSPDTDLIVAWPENGPLKRAVAKDYIQAATGQSNTTETLQTDTLSANAEAYSVKGYYEQGDGGEAIYTEWAGAFPSPGVIQNTDGQLLKLAINGVITPSQTGAVGDFNESTQTGTDNAPYFAEYIELITEALATTGQRRRGEMRFVPGYYRTTEILDFDQFGINLIGANPIAVKIFGDHDDGPVARMRRSRSSAVGIDFAATAARSAYAGTPAQKRQLPGLYMRGPDDDPILALCSVKNCIFSDQPGNGLVSTAAGSRFELLQADNCWGGGFAFDTGRLMGIDDADLDFVGWISIDTYRAKDCGGYALAIGMPADYSSKLMYRVHCRNGDLGNNANDEDALYVDHLGNPILAQNFANGNGMIFENHGFGGGAVGKPQVGLYVGGGSIDIRNNRFPEITTCVVVDEFMRWDGTNYVTSIPTRGVNISRMHVTNSAANPAVEVKAHVSAQAVTIDQTRTGNITTLSTGPVNWTRFGVNTTQNGNMDVTGDVDVTGKIVASESIQSKGFVTAWKATIQNDKYARIDFSTNDPWGRMLITGATVTAPAMDVAFRADAANGYNALIASSLPTGVVGTYGTVPTGTSGTPGNVTVTTANDGYMYIENRSGGTRNFDLFFIGPSENQWITAVDILPA